MQSKALGILDTLTQHRATVEKEARLTDLLRDPDGEGTPGWFMHVPKCFNDSLDIRQTTRIKDGKASIVWSQGCNFSFKDGDTVYDSPDAYGTWSEALKKLKVAIQVRSATDSGPQVVGSEGARQPGNVTFDILVPTADRTKVQALGCRTLTQFDFVRMLIKGDGLPTGVNL